MNSSDKCVVVVGGNLAHRPYVFSIAAHLNIRLITVLNEEEGLPASGVYRRLRWKPTGSRAAIESIAQELATALRDEKIDGVVSFEDHCVQLAGRLAELFGVARCPTDSLWLCRSKLDTYQALHCAGLPYAPNVLHLQPGANLAESARAIGLPAILRISHGNCAIGTRLVHSVTELEREVQRLGSIVVNPRHLDDFGMYENKLLLVQYLQGSEHDVDIVLQNGRLHFGYVTDNGSTDLPFFRETCHLLPSALSSQDQAELLLAAAECANALALQSGVFNVELRLTKEGPRLLEVNPRMGGFYIREHTLSVWEIDLCEAVFAIALGLPPPTANAQPRHYVAGFSCFSSDTVDLSDAPSDMTNLYLGNVPVDEYDVPVRMLSFSSDTPQGALRRAKNAAQQCLGAERGEVMQGHLASLLASAAADP